jgi:hypothetical protein
MASDDTQPSTSGTQPRRNTSGASTSGTQLASTPTASTSGTQAPAGPARNLRQIKKVNYKELHTGKNSFLGRQQFLK